MVDGRLFQVEDSCNWEEELSISEKKWGGVCVYTLAAPHAGITCCAALRNIKIHAFTLLQKIYYPLQIFTELD